MSPLVGMTRASSTNTASTDPYGVAQATGETRGSRALVSCWSLGAAAALLLIYAVLACTALDDNSATFDESNHLVRGLYALETGNFVLNRDHPPLVNMWQALPVRWLHAPALPTTPPTAADYPFFEYSRTVVWYLGNDGRALIHTARLATVAVTVALGVLVCVWSTQLHGTAGGLLSLSALMFQPMMLAHGTLVTTDMGLAAAMTLYWYAVWRFLRERTRLASVLAACALGCALASKHLAWLNVPATVLVLSLATAPGAGTAPLARAVVQCLAWTLGGLLVVWACYGFQIDVLPGGSLPVPAPDYWQGLVGGWTHLTQGRLYYLDGVRSAEGWFTYFPRAFLYKTPWSFLLLTLCAAGVSLRRGPRRATGAIAFAVLLMVALLVAKRANLGLRYWLFVYPFLAVMIGGLANTPRFGWWGVPLLVVLVADAWRAAPDYLAYFNFWIPVGEKNLRLVDSNLDWGQGLPALADFQRSHGIDDLRLGYFGTADVAAYGVEARPLPSFLTSPGQRAERQLEGTVAVSATLLQGMFVADDFYAPLRKVLPQAVLGGGTLLVFDCHTVNGSVGCGRLRPAQTSSLGD